MVRTARFLIVRTSPALFHRGHADPAPGDCERIDWQWREVQAFAPDFMAERKPIARERLPPDDLADVEGEPQQRRKRARFEVQMGDVEAPPALLPAAVLAHDTVEPALEPAGKLEVSGIDRQHERPVEHPFI